MSKIDHRHVVGVRNFFAEQSKEALYGYIELPYFTANAWQWVMEKRRDSVELQRVAFDTLCGLEHLHSNGIVHRDIQPHCIFLDQDGRARLGEFSRATSTTTSSAAAAATAASAGADDIMQTFVAEMVAPRYAAPELGRTAIPMHTFSTDVFAYTLTIFDLHAPRRAQQRPKLTDLISHYRNRDSYPFTDDDYKALLATISSSSGGGGGGPAGSGGGGSVDLFSPLKNFLNRGAVLIVQRRATVAELLTDEYWRAHERAQSAALVALQKVKRERAAIDEQKMELERARERQANQVQRIEEEAARLARVRARDAQHAAAMEQKRKKLEEERRAVEEERLAAEEIAQQVAQRAEQVQKEVAAAAAAAAEGAAAAAPPKYWTTVATTTTNSSTGGGGGGGGGGGAYTRVDVTAEFLEKMQLLFDNSSVWVYHDAGAWKNSLGKPTTALTTSPPLIVHGQDNRGLRHSGYKVVSIHRIENAFMWRRYANNRALLVEQAKAAGAKLNNETDVGIHQRVESYAEWQDGDLGVHAAANEAFLIHGTDAGLIDVIAREGIDSRLCGGLFGKGVYLAENVSKSDEYTKADADGVRYLFLCRATIGRPYVHTGNAGQTNAELVKNKKVKLSQLTRAPLHPDTGEPCDSLIHQCRRKHIKVDSASRSWPLKHSEYVVYERSLVYPEFLVGYRRINEQAATR